MLFEENDKMMNLENMQEMCFCLISGWKQKIIKKRQEEVDLDEETTREK